MLYRSRLLYCLIAGVGWRTKWIRSRSNLMEYLTNLLR